MTVRPIEIIRTNLTREMERAGFNPMSLSRAAGLNETAVRDLFRGKVESPRIGTLLALAAALGVPICRLIGCPQMPLRTPLAEKGRWIAELARRAS